MYFPKIASLNNGIRQLFSPMIEPHKQVLYSWQRKIHLCDKNVHADVMSSTRKRATPPKNFIFGQQAQPPSCFVRYASSEDDVVCHGDLRKLNKSGKVLLIDVRGKDETWRTGTIPGSLCIPLPELESALKLSPEKFKKDYCREKPNLNDEIVFVCRRGERSYKAMKQARTMGYEKSKTYQGGFMGWFNQERIIRERKSKSPNKH